MEKAFVCNDRLIRETLNLNSCSMWEVGDGFCMNGVLKETAVRRLRARLWQMLNY